MKTHAEYPLIGEFDTVLWDWNGTLLNDVHANINTINRMLDKRGLNPLNLATYKESFCFPVSRFYRQIGFDLEKETIEQISVEYHVHYKSFESDITIHPDAASILNTFSQKGIQQYILSACIKEDLLRMIDRFGLTSYFQAIYGADDICAHGKIGLGEYLIRHHSLDPSRTLMIGDTLHDAEVARALGVNLLLYSGGHNSYRLLSEEDTTVKELKEVLSFCSGVYASNITPSINK